MDHTIKFLLITDISACCLYYVQLFLFCEILRKSMKNKISLKFIFILYHNIHSCVLISKLFTKFYIDYLISKKLLKLLCNLLT